MEVDAAANILKECNEAKMIVLTTYLKQKNF